MVDDFASARQAYQDFKKQSDHEKRQLKNVQQQRSQLQSRLAMISKRRSDLDNQEQKLHDADGRFEQQINSLKHNQQARVSQESELRQRLNQARINRNQDLSKWFFKKYRQFDNLTLGQLQDWLDRCVNSVQIFNGSSNSNVNVGNSSSNQGSSSTSSSSGNNDDGKHRHQGVIGEHDVHIEGQPRTKGKAKGQEDSDQIGNDEDSANNNDGSLEGKSQYLKVQDERRRLVREARETKMGMKSVSRSTKNKTKSDEDQNQAGMTLAEKQRIFINQDENDPIDTFAEAEDAEALDSPLGNRDAEEDAEKYLERQQKNKRAAMKKYSKTMDGFEL